MTRRSDLVLDPVVTPGVLSAKLWIRRGSGRDQQGQRGGHQLLGSVLSRGCGPLDHLELADLVEGCGAGLRCDTHEDGILISLKCRDLDADRLLPAVGWMVRQPHLNESQIALERELSLQALQRQREDPFHRAFDGWRQIAYGQGPYGHDPLGIAQDLERLSRPQLQRLAHDLESEGSVLALSGAIPADANERLQEWFGPITSQSPVNQAKADDAPANESSADNSSAKNPSANNPSGNNRDRPSISVQPLATEQVVLMLGQASLPHGHSDDLALRLLQAHLGSGMSSLLFRRLREEHGVAYDVGVHHPARAGAAPFVMHASTGVDRAALTLELLMASWTELLENCIEAADLHLAAAKFRGHSAHASQTTGQRAERRAQLRGLGLPDQHDQQCLQKLETLQSSDLLAAAQRHLQKPQLSLCGPSDTLATLERLWMQDALAGTPG